MNEMQMFHCWSILFSKPDKNSSSIRLTKLTKQHGVKPSSALQTLPLNNDQDQQAYSVKFNIENRTERLQSSRRVCKLKHMNLKNNDLCVCGESETVQHLFMYCKRVEPFWNISKENVWQHNFLLTDKIKLTGNLHDNKT